MTFIEWLSQEIRIRKWTQAELADRAGVTRGAVSHIFSGTRQPGIDMLKAVAHALNLSTEEVFRAAGVLEPDLERPPSLNEWVHMYMEADGPTRDVMMENARFFSERSARKKSA